ncbi:MAG: NFACT RNA binding domain-containing protein [Anaerolineae bacterium]
MSFDVFATAALVDELNDALAGGRVQKIIDLSETAVGFEVYANRQRRYLVLDADSARPYGALVEEKLRRGLPRPAQLGLLLRRYVEGGGIERVTQMPWERVFTLRIDHPEGVSEIIVELVERRANILLVQEGLILDCIRRVGIQENRVRQSLPGRDYQPPPPIMNKTRPDRVSLADVERWLEAEPDAPAWRLLTRHVLGVSPTLARELVFRVTGAAREVAGATSARAMFDVFTALMAPLLAGEWQPGFVPDEAGMPATFAVYPITYLPGWQATETVSAAVVACYGVPAGEDAYARAKAPVQEQLREAIARVSHKAESLRQSLRSEQELEILRKSGELLLAYQYAIAPGTTTFEAEYDPGEPPIAIQLDPALSPLENAKQYFARYEKAKRAAADVPKRLQAAEQELAFLRQLEVDLALASNWPEIDEVREALEQEGYWRGARTLRPRTGKSAPLKTEIDGFQVWIGRNSRQNDQVTFSRAGADDLWLHARAVPGSHVIIKTGGREVPEAVIQRAAELAAYYSAARDETRTLVDVTQRRYVRKIGGGKPGMVTYRNETTREVTPRGLEDA